MSSTIVSFRRQHLLVEFSSLRYAQLDGVFMSITPDDPSTWVGVIFVRKGPYAPAVLRFQISFPSSYPALPPLVIFSTDVFHPLLTPLTTYTYTTGSSDTDTVSATDDERLPPGGFSLRHGFPHWFGRARRHILSSREANGSMAGSPVQDGPSVHAEFGSAATDAFGVVRPSIRVSVPMILDYIRSTFCEEAVLDSVPLEAAANQGAYHAWRAHRGPSLQTRQPALGITLEASDNVPESPALGRNRRPGEWNWEGVWEERVKKAVNNSLSEPMLFGTGVGEDIIRFRNGDAESEEQMKRQLEIIVSRIAKT